MGKILVTGSSGFIGAQLIDDLLRNGHMVGGIDINSPATKLPWLRFFECDILNKQSLLDCFHEFKPEIVLHLAARIDLDGTSLNDYAANIDGVRNIVDCIRNTPYVKRCIFTSSQLVCRVGYVPKEENDFQPNTFYGESKVLTEKIVRENDGGGVEWCIVRPTTIWGPGMSPHYQRLFRSISKGIYFHVGNSPLWKSYGFVKNTAYQYRKLTEAPSILFHQKVMYLADYEPLSLRAWIDKIAHGLGREKVMTLPYSAAKTIARFGDMLNSCGIDRFPYNSFRLNNILTEYQFNLTSTKDACGELPFSVDEGIEDTLAWLKTI